MPATIQAVNPYEAAESFDSFYRREFAPMVRLAAAVGGDSASAEDIAQEALNRAYTRWDKISGYEKPGAWLRRVTINLSLSSRSRAQRDLIRARRLGPEPSVPPPDEPHSAVWDAVKTLPRNQRAAIALHYLEDRSVEEIASILGCSRSTAKVHLHRGRTTLQRKLEDHR